MRLWLRLLWQPFVYTLAVRCIRVGAYFSRARESIL